ncbi:hypothetical protein HDU92_007069, partial [Lobulomyces angularis]
MTNSLTCQESKNLMQSYLVSCGFSTNPLVDLPYLAKVCQPGDCNLAWVKFTTALSTNCEETSTNSINPMICCSNQVLCLKALQPANSVSLSPTLTTSNSETSLETNPVNECKTYVIKKDDICWDIAEANKISLVEFLKFNAGINCDSLVIGQKVCLSSGSIPGSTAATSTSSVANATSTLNTSPTSNPLNKNNSQENHSKKLLV